MELLFVERATVELYPAGRPESRFGATFGPLDTVPPPPFSAPRRLSAQARDAMRIIQDHFRQIYHENGLVFAATSGFEIRNLRRGPHVASYHSMLLKRAILESNCPVVFLLDEDKLSSEFVESRCFAVCDEEFTWADACNKTPISLACAFRSEKSAQEALPLLAEMGFVHREPARAMEEPWPLIVANDCFWAMKRHWQDAARRLPSI